MELLYLIEKIRNPVLDFFFEAITYLGSEIAFLTIAIIFFWCINKREGIYILVVGLFGTVVNQALKLIFKIERPWIKDPSFQPVGNSKLDAGGYSFPSGHTQSATGNFGAIAAFSKKRISHILCVALICLVAFSRMYLGVHTPWDVLASLALASLMVIAFYPIFKSEGSYKKYMPYVTVLLLAVALVFLIYANTVSFDGLNQDNYESAKKNSAMLFGCAVGLLVVYTVDSRYIKFETDGVWYSQAIKLTLGLAILLLLKETLRAPLEAVVGVFTDEPVYIARAIRYFIIVVFAGNVWPLTFKFFKRLRIGFMDKLTEKIASIFNKSSTPTD